MQAFPLGNDGGRTAQSTFAPLRLGGGNGEYSDVGTESGLDCGERGAIERLEEAAVDGGEKSVWDVEAVEVVDASIGVGEARNAEGFEADGLKLGAQAASLGLAASEGGEDGGGMGIERGREGKFGGEEVEGEEDAVDVADAGVGGAS